jgi:YVTN family beta-propeller protein
MNELPRGAVTFLFTDIEGSTQLVRALRDRYAEVLAEHQRLLREAFAKHGGHEIDTQGDAFFYAFGSAHEAVLAAIEAQRAVSGYPWPDNAPVKVRMGIHTGQSAPVDGRYTGLAVHRAARICAAGHGGQVLVSQATQSLLEDEEEDLAVGLRDLGEQRLKDIERPVRLYQVGAAGLPAEFPPLRHEEPPEALLPAPVPLYRRPLVLGTAFVAASLLAAAVTAAVLLAGDDAPPAVVPGSLVRIDPGSNEITDVVKVSRRPLVLAAVGRWLFTTNDEENTLSRVDSRSGEVRTIGSVGDPLGLARGGEGSLWVGNLGEGEVTQIDAATLRVVRRVGVPGVSEATFLSVGGGRLWVSHGFFNPAQSSISRIRLPEGTVERTFRLASGASPAEIAIGEGAAWVALIGIGDLLRIDLADGRTTRIDVTPVPSDPTIGFGSVWVAGLEEGRLFRIDPATRDVRDIIPVGDRPAYVAVGAGAVWVTNAGDGTVSRVDPETRRVTATIETGFHPVGIDFADGAVWVSLSPDDPFASPPQ